MKKYSKHRFLLTSTIALAIPTASTATEPTSPHPALAKFEGRWTLKDDKFQQVWDGSTLQTLTIPNHITDCAPVNTEHSMLCVVDAGDLQGHILWVLSEDGRSVSHLSHFGTRRVGVGNGEVLPERHVELRISFEDEPPGAYRRYSYRWLGADTYKMTSVQYDTDDQPTGNWYGGTFVRVAQKSEHASN